MFNIMDPVNNTEDIFENIKTVAINSDDLNNSLNFDFREHIMQVEYDNEMVEQVLTPDYLNSCEFMQKQNSLSTENYKNKQNELLNYAEMNKNTEKVVVMPNIYISTSSNSSDKSLTAENSLPDSLTIPSNDLQRNVKCVNSNLNYSKLCQKNKINSGVFHAKVKTEVNLGSKDQYLVLKNPNLVFDNNFRNNISVTNVPETKESVQHKCNRCNKKFSNELELNNHRLQHAPRRPYQCIACGRTFQHKNAVKKHLKSHKVWQVEVIHSLKNFDKSDGKKDLGNGTGAVNGFSCLYCEESFSTYIDYKIHLVKLHRDKKLFQCIQKKCKQLFHDEDEFLTHVLAHSDMGFDCYLCEEKFQDLDTFADHQRLHYLNVTKGATRKCNLCSREFKNLMALRKHLRTETQTYKCKICKKVFISENFLIRHMKLFHKNVEIFECDVGSKIFPNEEEYNLHRKDACDSAYPDKDAVQENSNKRNAVPDYILYVFPPKDNESAETEDDDTFTIIYPSLPENGDKPECKTYTFKLAEDVS